MKINFRNGRWFIIDTVQTKELLSYLEKSNIIDMAYVQEQIEMKKKADSLSKHPYKISQGKDGYWRTYLPDEQKGRRMLKKSTRDAIEKEVIAFWKNETENPTIKEVFDEWNDRRLKLKKITSSTHLRYTQTFNRYFSEFGNKRIKSIAPDDIEEFLEEQIPKHDLSAKAFSNLKSVAKGFLKRAKKRKLVDFNVEELFQDLDTSDSDFKKVIKEDSKEVFDEDELPKMFEYLISNLDLRNLGILLMFLTGIRVGELVALKHSDFEGNTFKIRRTETRLPSEKGGYIYEVKEFPKSEAGVRTVIIPKDYAWICTKIKMQNPFGEYIFEEKGKRLTTNCIRRRMERVCKKLNISSKSPHKARKTYCSILLDNNIDNKLITDVMGHTDIACSEGYYHRNRRSIERKSEIISSIPEFIAK
ncbi:MAG: tyrosine-type recombinase/integrase [Blautia sp.]|nr:tyrosine-type recombinase/integrase [Blautia sp.]